MTAQTEAADAVKDAILRKLRFDIGKLDRDSSPDAIAEIIQRMADCGLDKINCERLLQTVKGQTGTGLSVLRQQLADAIRARRAAGRDTDRIAGMILDAFGDPCPLEANAALLVREKLPGLFALDEFHQQPMVMREPPWSRPGEAYPRPLTDADDAALLSWAQRQGVHLRGRNAIRTVMSEIIHDNVFHPVREYLDGLQWDGGRRLDQWLSAYLGAEDLPDYTAVVGPKWLISAVARIYRPGCIAKYCLILLGPQDIGKSTALSVLGGEFYTDDISELGTKDAAMQNAGVWIVELAELASTRKAHLDAVKAFISRATDRFRPPYGMHPIARPRQSVLAGTVNPSDAFLRDETGNVRFWPITCTKIDLGALRRDRNQLWAEAVHRFRAGENWWLEDAGTIAAAHEAREAHSETIENQPWFSTIAQWIEDEEKLVYATAPERRLRLSDNSLVFTIDEILDRLGIAIEKRGDARLLTLIGKILRARGWKPASVRLVSDKRAVVWRWQRAVLTCNKRMADGARWSKPLTPSSRECPDHGQDIGVEGP